MINHSTTPSSILLKSCKDTKGKLKHNKPPTSKNIFLSAIDENVWTTRGLSRATSLKIPTICRLKRDLEQLGILVTLYRSRCPISGLLTYHYTSQRYFDKLKREGRLEVC